MSSGGGGSSQPTSSTVTQSNIPEWQRPHMESLYGQAQALTDINRNPYQNYSGERVAGFSPQQTQAFNQLQGMQVPGQTTDASNITYNAAQQAGNYQNYGPQQFQTQQANNPALMQSYMNPYIQTALDPTLQLMQQNAGINQRNLSQQAQRAGAFGGYRQGIQQAVQAGQDSLAQGNVIGNMYNTGYGQASQNMQTDAARKLAADQAGEQSRQFGANLGLSGLQTQLQGAGQLGQLGQSQLNQQLGLNQAQQLAGAQQQQNVQQGLDVGYQNFLDQQNWAYKNLGFLSEILGRPMANSTQSMYSAPPSTSQNLLGLGLGAYGLSGMMGRKRGGTVRKFAGGGIMTPQEIQLAQQSKDPFRMLSAGRDAQLSQQLHTAQPLPPETTLPPQDLGGGIAQVPAQNMQTFRDGGIVGDAEGGPAFGEISDEEVARRGRALREGLSSAWDIASYPSRKIRGAIGDAYQGMSNLGVSALRGIGIPMDYAGRDASTGLLAQNARELNRVGSTGAPTLTPADVAQNARELSRAGPTDRAQTVATMPEGTAAVRTGGSGVASVAPPAFKFEDAPETERPDEAGLMAQFRRLQEEQRQNNPLYAERDKMAGRFEEHKKHDPYAAAIAAAQAIMGGRQGKGTLESLAVGVGAAGEGQLKREEQHTARQEKLFQMDAALRQGDMAAAGHIQDQLLKSGMKYDEIQAGIYKVRETIRGGLEQQRMSDDTRLKTAGIAAAAHRDAARMGRDDMMAMRQAQLNEQAMVKAMTQAKQEVELRVKNMGVEKIDWDSADIQRMVTERAHTLLPMYFGAAQRGVGLPELLKLVPTGTSSRVNAIPTGAVVR